MSRVAFDNECSGCQPIAIDPQTGKPAPDDSPVMRGIYSVWQTTTIDERQAFHRCCCLNSKDPADLTIMDSLVFRFGAAVEFESEKETKK